MCKYTPRVNIYLLRPGVYFLLHICTYMYFIHICIFGHVNAQQIYTHMQI